MQNFRLKPEGYMYLLRAGRTFCKEPGKPGFRARAGPVMVPRITARYNMEMAFCVVDAQFLT